MRSLEQTVLEFAAEMMTHVPMPRTKRLTSYESQCMYWGSNLTSYVHLKSGFVNASLRPKKSDFDCIERVWWPSSGLQQSTMKNCWLKRQRKQESAR